MGITRDKLASLSAGRRDLPDTCSLCKEMSEHLLDRELRRNIRSQTHTGKG